MNRDEYETEPIVLDVFDLGDIALVGWEVGRADDGDIVLQARCEQCGITHSLKLPPGAFIKHDPPGMLHMRHGQFGGPMKRATRSEPPGDSL